MSETSLPGGFRIITTCFGGSGRGDELFAPTLQHWSTQTEREGFFRRQVQRTGWRTVERGSPFAGDEENRSRLKATALMLANRKREESL